MFHHAKKRDAEICTISADTAVSRRREPSAGLGLPKSEQGVFFLPLCSITQKKEIQKFAPFSGYCRFPQAGTLGRTWLRQSPNEASFLTAMLHHAKKRDAEICISLRGGA